MHKIGKKVKLSARLYGALVSPGALGDGLTEEKIPIKLIFQNS